MPQIVRPMLTIGYSSHGEVDYAAHFAVTELSWHQMQELRAMIPVAIANLEKIWMEHGPPAKEMAQARGKSD